MIEAEQGMATIVVGMQWGDEGKRQEVASVDTAIMERSVAQYEELEGWSEDISRCTSFNQLPRAAQRYVEFIEDKLDKEIDVIGVGPGRRQTINRHQLVAA